MHRYSLCSRWWKVCPNCPGLMPYWLLNILKNTHRNNNPINLITDLGIKWVNIHKALHTKADTYYMLFEYYFIIFTTN